MMYVICRLMSQLPGVNIQSSIGMFTFMMSYIVLTAYIVLGYLHIQGGSKSVTQNKMSQRTK